jgi:micrococcal nuclease
MTTLAALALLLALNPAAREPFDARTVAVHDGDTITVLRNGHEQVRIRLEGIDCPELHQDFGQRAKQFTSNLVFGRVVRVIPKDVDRYGRVVARVTVAARDVSLELLRGGMAWHFKRYNNEPALARLEEEARKARVGLWIQPNPLPPWEYRHAQPPDQRRRGSPRSYR